MSRLSFIARAVLIFLLILPTVAYASSFTGTLAITCTDASDFTGVVTLNRDNTGTGSENYQIVATDRAGTILRSFTNTLPLGNYSYGVTFFTTPPILNPITVTLTSLAGNSLPAQQVFSQQGICGNLVKVPTLSDWGVITLAGLLAMAALFGLRRRRQ